MHLFLWLSSMLSRKYLKHDVQEFFENAINHGRKDGSESFRIPDPWGRCTSLHTT